MTKEKYRVLTYLGYCVEHSELTRGIYVASKPLLFTKFDTVDKIKKDWIDAMARMGVTQKEINTMVENLNQCKLTLVEMSEIEESAK